MSTEKAFSPSWRFTTSRTDSAMLLSPKFTDVKLLDPTGIAITDTAPSPSMGETPYTSVEKMSSLCVMNACESAFIST